jgi:hypothetical protein
MTMKLGPTTVNRNLQRFRAHGTKHMSGSVHNLGKKLLMWWKSIFLYTDLYSYIQVRKTKWPWLVEGSNEHRTRSSLPCTRWRQGALRGLWCGQKGASTSVWFPRDRLFCGAPLLVSSIHNDAPNRLVAPTTYILLQRQTRNLTARWRHRPRTKHNLRSNARRCHDKKKSRFRRGKSVRRSGETTTAMVSWPGQSEAPDRYESVIVAVLPRCPGCVVCVEDVDRTSSSKRKESRVRRYATGKCRRRGRLN